MGWFNDVEQASGVDTEKKTNKGGLAISGTIFVLLTLATQPLIVILFAIFAIIGEKRRVRLSRWAGATVATWLIGIMVAGFSPATWFGWWPAGAAMLWQAGTAPLKGIPLLSLIAETADNGQYLFLKHALFATPVALFLMSIWWWARSYSLRLRGQNEGEEYSDRRPVGFLDKWRRKRNLVAVQSGQWSTRHPGEIAIGIGTYGDVASAMVDNFKKAFAIVGTSRSGKTRLANSIVAQQVHELSGGNITIDLKGDDDMARAKAKLAYEKGVPFLHFKMMPKTGGGYRQPHPFAPDRPAHYDPFQRGNGASKASMLLGSVPRDGDAAVYERTSLEIVQLAFDIAALTGFDRQRNAQGFPVSGLSILLQMLDPDTLTQKGTSITGAQVKQANPFLSTAAADRKATAIRARVESLEKELANRQSVVNAAIGDVRSLVATYINDPSVGMFLNPGTTPLLEIDLVRAILRNEIVLFSLPAQDYPKMASMIATMVLLDLQSAVSTLRQYHQEVAHFLNAESHVADGTPWNPMTIQIEELGSTRSPAAAEAMLGLFNKSADVNIRPILSTQSLSDIEAVDSTGVWLRQLFGQLSGLVSFQLSVAQDAETFAGFSGTVSKKIPTEQKEITSTRTGLFQGAGSAGRLMARQETVTRIGEGDALALDIEQRQLLWVSKSPKITAVHTTAPEGPNNWSEVLTLTPVWEPPYQWRPFSDEEYVEVCKEKQRTVYEALIEDLETNPMLHKILNAAEETLDVTATAAQDAFEPPLPLENLPEPNSLPAAPMHHPEPEVSRPRDMRPHPSPRQMREEDLAPHDRTIPMDYDTFDEQDEDSFAAVPAGAPRDADADLFDDSPGGDDPFSDEEDPFGDVSDTDPFGGDDDPFAPK